MQSKHAPSTQKITLRKAVPHFSEIKAVYKEAEEEPELVYLLNQCHQWLPGQSGMFLDATSSFQSPQYNAQQYNMWQNQPQPPFPNWSPQSFPSSTSWPNQASQSSWPNFPYAPPYWQSNAYPAQWTPPASQSLA